MPSFRQRPLTWLFFIALTCLNFVAIATDFRLDWYADLIAGQVFIAAGWFVLGRAHRLARAGMLIATVVASAMPDFLMGASDVIMWRYVLGSLIVLAAATVAGCWVWLLVERLIGGLRPTSAGFWRFSVAEILGWTILVAVGVQVVPTAVFSHMFGNDGYWKILAATSAVAALAMTLFLRRRFSDRISAAATMVAVTVAFVYMARFDVHSDFAELAWAYTVVGVWILVQRLDELRANGESSPIELSNEPLRVFDPELDDERRRLG